MTFVPTLTLVLYVWWSCRPVLDICISASYGAMLTPLLVGRGSKQKGVELEKGKPLNSLKTYEDISDHHNQHHTSSVTDIAEEDHTPGHTPSPPPPPTPLLRNHLHAAKVRHSKSQMLDSSGKSSTTSSPDFCLPPIAPNWHGDSDSLRQAGKGEESLSHPSPAPLASTPARSEGLRAVSGDTFDTGEDVFGAVRRNVLDSPNLLDKIHSEMLRRQQRSKPMAAASGLVVQSRRAEERRGMWRDGKEKVPSLETSVSKPRSYKQPSHYSATLGMDFGDLPRRKLRGVARGCGEDLEGEGIPHPSSPSLLSASLGITLPAGRKRRGGGAPHKENLLDVSQSHDLTLTPPPILKILDSNAKRRRIEKRLPPIAATSSDHGGQRSTRGTERTFGPLRAINCPPANEKPPGGNPPEALDKFEGNPPPPEPTVVKATPTIPPQSCSGATAARRFKSPWRWASISGRPNYTPIKSKGSVRK